MLDSGFDAILVLDADDRITGWNHGATELYGWTRDEALGQVAPALLQTKPPKPRDEILADVLHDGHWEGELSHRRKDGRAITVFSRWTLERDSSGQRAAILETNMDITARKQAEAQIAADLRGMTLLNQLSNRLVREGGNFDENLSAVLDAAIAITGAVKGSLRLLDPTNEILNLAAHRGFDEPAYLNLFTAMPVDASAYATVIKSGERLIIEDLRESELHVGNSTKELIKEVLLGAGVRAVTAEPLIASTGTLLGILATHFAAAHRPNENELHLMDLLARQTADYLERKRAHEIQTTLAREVQHRSFNLLAIVQTIASQSLSGSRTLAEAKKAFEARLQALARTNRQLTQSNWSGATLSDIVRLELQPFVDRIAIDGADVTLSAQHAQNFGLALHELATNAAKYGALSNASGRVGISWAITKGKSQSKTLVFRWQERAGPPVVMPNRHGFGTTLINTAFPNARIYYAVEGFSCEIDIPLERESG
jgi:PAS domain S-box-containing protein